MAQGNPEKAAVLTAFFAARAANRPAVECYKAGVQVWKGLHPEQAPGYATKVAVQVILDAVAPDIMSVEHEGIRRPGTEDTATLPRSTDRSRRDGSHVFHWR